MKISKSDFYWATRDGILSFIDPIPPTILGGLIGSSISSSNAELTAICSFLAGCYAIADEFATNEASDFFRMNYNGYAAFAGNIATTAAAYNIVS